LKIYEPGSCARAKIKTLSPDVNVLTRIKHVMNDVTKNA